MTPRHLSSGIWLASGSAVVSEIASRSGFGWLLLDLEHGCLTESEVLHHLMAVKGSPAKAIVRVGKTDPVLIARVLDWGADGIMLPHAASAGQVKECLEAMYYPPRGNRGYTSAARAFGYGTMSPESPAALESPLFLAQIEDEESVRNADEIAMTPGVDVLFVGPSDLKLYLTAHASSITFREALYRVAEAAKRHGKQAGILVKDQAELPALQTMGFSCLALGSDLGVLRKGFKDLLVQGLPVRERS